MGGKPTYNYFGYFIQNTKKYQKLLTYEIYMKSSMKII